MGTSRARFSAGAAVRAALGTVALVALLALPLAALLPHSFFESWGWAVGPAAWMISAAVVAAVLGLPMAMALVGAVLAGAVSGAFVALGLHWPAVGASIIAFAVWCGWLAARTQRSAAS